MSPDAPEQPPRCAPVLRTALRAGFAATAAAALLIGIAFLRTGVRLRAECREAETAHVLDTGVDLGAPGKHTAALKQIAEFPCRQYIRLTPPVLHGGGDRPHAAIDGLELTVAVTDTAGVERLTGTFPSPLALRDDPSVVTLAEAPPIPRGDYTVTIDVVTPVPALAGHPVRLTSGYILCGLEWMGPTVGIVVGSAAVTIGAVIGIALALTRRAGTPPTSLFPIANT